MPRQPLQQVPPRPKDRQSTEQALVTAAVEEFSAKGFERATTREIAAKAGCAEALIHRYFKSKEGLLLAIFRSSAKDAELSAQIIALPPASSLFDEIRNILIAGAHRFRSRGAITRIIVSRVILDPAFQRDFDSVTTRAEGMAILVERLRLQQSVGHIAEDADLQAAAGVISSIIFQIGFMYQEVMKFSEDEIAGLIETHAKVLTTGIGR